MSTIEVLIQDVMSHYVHITRSSKQWVAAGLKTMNDQQEFSMKQQKDILFKMGQD